MDAGILYLIIFNDGEAIRSKRLVFDSSDADSLTFVNPRNDMIEIISKRQFIRAEALNKNGEEKNG